MIYQQSLEINTVHGRGFYPLDKFIHQFIKDSHVTAGLCHIYLPHTSASLMITENADTTVLKDLEAFMRRLVPDGDSLFKHTAEGRDDMPAHIRAALTQTAVSIPIIDHVLALGTWQGVFLWEHRLKAHRRKIFLSVLSNDMSEMT